MAIILSADPGIKGALTLLDTAKPDRLLAYWPMPTQIVQKAAGKEPSPEVNIAGIVKLIGNIAVTHGPSLFAAEKVGGMPGQSASAAFNFGQGYGALIAAATMAGIPIAQVPPSVWKKVMRAPKDKVASVALAAATFPASEEMIRKAAAGIKQGGNADKGGCAESGLLALYAARHILNVNV